jgi:hypothetical protein
MGERRSDGSEMDTPRQLVSCARPVCQRSWTDFKPVWMLRAFRRQSPTDSQTLGLLCSEECALSISLADRAAAGVPAVLALRDSTWKAKLK